MTNPVVHAIVLIAAIVVPGGLLLYFAWRAARKSISFKGKPNHMAQKEGSGNIPVHQSTPQEARSAFEAMFPKDSLRAQNRRKKLDRVKAFRHRNFKK